MRTNKVVVTLVAILFLVSMVGTVKAVEMRTFVADEYTMDVPVDWNYRHVDYKYRITDIFSIDDVHLPKNESKAWVTIDRWDFTKSTSECTDVSSLDELADCILSDLIDRGFKVYSYYTTINGERAWVLESYRAYHGSQGVFENQVHQYYFPLNETVHYIIHCEAQEFDKYNREYFEPMVQSFKFIDKPQIIEQPMPTPTNLLKNPGFEDGFNNWERFTEEGNVDFYIGASAHSGSKSGGIHIMSSGGWGHYSQEVPISNCKNIHAEVWAKLAFGGDDKAEFAVRTYDVDGILLDHEDKSVGSTEWTKISLDFSPDPNAVSAVVFLDGASKVDDYVIFDDAYLGVNGSAIGNHPPTATKIEPTSDSRTIEPGNTQEFKVKAEDVDEEVHNNLKMIEWFVDDVLMETDAADGTSAEVSFSYTFENAGTFSVKATVYDEQMEEDSVTWEVNVGEDVGLIEKEILDKDGNEIGLKVRIEYPTTLSLKESGNSELGWLDIQLKTKDFEGATFPDDYTNLVSGYIMAASDEDTYVDLDGVEFEVAPVPQMLHHEAFGWKDYINFLEQEKNEWGWRTFALILSVIPGTSEVMTLQEAFGIVWKEMEYDIGGEPRDISFYDMNNYDIWKYPWTFELNSIAGAVSEQRGNGVHLRIPFVYENAGKHGIHIFLFIDYNGRKGSGLLDSSPSYTIGKEYTCDINVG